MLLLAAIAVDRVAAAHRRRKHRACLLHLIPAAVATIVAGVAARFWRARPTRLDRFARRALVGALSFFAAAQILEGADGRGASDSGSGRG